MKKAVLWVTLIAFVGQPFSVMAQVVAAGSTPGTQVGTAQNGVTVVQIAAPSGAGVSRNQYQQFDVDSKGVVLNNSRTLTQTQQAGWIEGNANLGGGAARIILNEVTSSLPSNLRGYTEVGGQKAEVIIANPNGITCNGCGFINTTRGVLTTGVPVFGGSGSLEAFRVTKGHISIEGTGLNGANVDRIDLIARSVQVNANLWAKNLNAVTGSNLVDYETLGTQVIAGEGGYPTIGLDVAALGGMYANKIRLVGTEAGVGVNVGGTIATQASDIQLSSNGLLTVTGTISSSGKSAIQAVDGVVNKGVLVSTDDISVVSAGGLSNSGGSITAGNSISLEASAQLDNSNGVILASGQVNVTAATVRNTGGQIASTGPTGHLQMAVSGELDNSQGKLQSQGYMQLSAGSLANTGGSVVAVGPMELSVGSLFDNRQGAVSASGDAKIQAAVLKNSEGLIQAENDLDMSLGQWVSGGKSLAGRDLLLTVLSGYIQPADSSLKANRDLTIKSAGGIASFGQVAAVRRLVVEADGWTNGGAGTLVAPEMSFLVTQGWRNEGKLTANTISIVSASIENAGSISGAGDISLRGDVLKNEANASISAGGKINNTISGDVVNLGEIYGDNVDLRAKNITNKGLIGANNNLLALASEQLLNTTNSTLYAGNDIQLGVGNLTNQEDGLIWAANNLSVTGIDGASRATSIENTMGRLEANAGSLTLKAETIRNIGQAPEVIQTTFSDSAGSGYLNGCYAGNFYCKWNEDTQAYDSNWGVKGINEAAFQAFLNRNPGLKSPSLYNWLYVIGSSDYGNPRSDGNGHEMEERGVRFWVSGTTDVAKAGGAVKAGNMVAGSNMHIDAGLLRNEYSNISADGNVLLTGGSLENVGKVLQKKTVISQHFLSNSGTPAFTRSMILTEDLDEIPAVIHAGGTLDIQMSGSVVNNSQSGASHILTGQPRTEIFTGVGPASVKTVSVSLPNGIVLKPDGSLDFSSSSIPGSSGTFTSLFGHASPNQNYLIETNPRFSNYKNFISSDYMLTQLGLDPDATMKRLGDGYYESQLVNAQIKSKTGQSTLSGYANAKDQYAALLSAGALEAKDLNLTLGIKLTAAQIAQLTQSIVWLEEEMVGGQKVLVPVVYVVAASNEGGGYDSTHQGRGATLSGSNVVINSGEPGKGTATIINSGAIIGTNNLNISGSEITNTGKLTTETGGSLTVAASENLSNIGGHILGGDVTLSAQKDLISRAAQESVNEKYDFGTLTGTMVGAAGEIQSTGKLNLNADRDLQLAGTTVVAGGNARIDAGRDLLIEAAASQTRSVTQGQHSRSDTTEIVNQGTTIVVGGTLDLVSQRDIKISGSTASAADIKVDAGQNLTVTAVTDSRQGEVSGRSGRNQYRDTNRDESVKGSALQSTGNLTLLAKNDVDLTASSLYSVNGAVSVEAGGNLTIGGIGEVHSRTHDSEKKGFMSRGKDHDSVYDNYFRGSSISGNSVSLTAVKDIAVTGSQVVGTVDVLLDAGRDLVITSGQDYHSERHERSESSFGVFSNGGASISLGSRKFEQNSKLAQVTQQGSVIGSVTGDVTLLAERKADIVASQVMAPQGDIAVEAQQVNILSANNTSSFEQQTHYSQTGVTLSISNPVVAAVQTAQQMATAASKTSDSRIQALALANTALAAKNAYGSVSAGQGQVATGGKNPDGSREMTDGNLADKAGGINASISFGSSKSDSSVKMSSSTSVGSDLTAGGDIRITARGEKNESGSPANGITGDITVAGSHISSGGDVTLTAADDINLWASRNDSTQTGSNSSSSASIGVGFNLGAGEAGVSVNASASKSRGNSNGSDLSWTETTIQAGNLVDIESGGNTTLKGAIVEGKQIVADIGGNLAIESLQDQSTYDSKKSNSGFSVSVPVTGGSFSGNISSGGSKIESDYKSVVEQSGFKAGNDGFLVIVGGNTDLKGGVIASTDKAVEDGKNSFNTEGTLTLSSLDNKADYKGTGSSINIGAGISMDGKLAPGGTGAGGGKEEGSASSTTQSGISGIAGNKDVRTGDGSNGIGKIFDAQKVQDSIDAQIQITQMFGQLASKAIGDYAKEKTDEAKVLREQAKREPDEGRALELTRRAQELEDQWGDQGTLRLTAHTLVGGLTGGPGGAGGAAVGTLTAPAVAEALEKAGIGGPLASTLTAIASTAAGAVVGGSSGAGAALNEVTNNYLTHEQKSTRDRQLSQCKDPDTCQRIKDYYSDLDRKQDVAALQLIEQVRSCSSELECRAIQEALRVVSREIYDAERGGVIQAEMQSKLIKSGAALQEVERKVLDYKCDASTGCKSVVAGVGIAAGLATGGGVAKLLQYCLSPAGMAACNSATIEVLEVLNGLYNPIKVGAGVGATAKVISQIEKEAIEKTKIELNIYRDWPVSDNMLEYRVSQLASRATRNDGASTVVLGKYIEGSSRSYDEVAQSMGATYFSLPGYTWKEAEIQLGAEKMWEINRKFINSQVSQGKSFVFTSDPRLPDAGYYTRLEFGELSSRGYSLILDGGFYRAVKK